MNIINLCCLYVVLTCHVIYTIPSSSMYNDKMSFRKESITLYEKYKKNQNPCFTEVMSLLETKCSPKNGGTMDTPTKIMMAAHLMNCQYLSAGRKTHWINDKTKLNDEKESLKQMDTYFKDLGSDDYNIEMIALYFTHVDIICYYMNRIDWNKRYYAQLEQVSSLSEEIWNQLAKVQQSNVELLAKQNSSKDVISMLSSITANSYRSVKNASNQLIIALSNINISAENSKNLIVETLGLIIDLFYKVENIVKLGLWNMYKFGGIMFFTVLSLYILFISHITHTEYTRTTLMVLLWLLFVVDALLVFFVIRNQPLKHLNKYVIVLRMCSIVIMSVSWVLLSYYIPRWLPVTEISCLFDASNKITSSNLSAASAIRKGQRKTLSILNDVKTRRHINSSKHNLDSNDSSNSNDDSESSDSYNSSNFKDKSSEGDDKFTTAVMDHLPKPMSVSSSDQQQSSLLATSAKYFHNVVDSLKLVSPAKRIFGSFHPSFATSTVIREATNKKPLSPQILKRSTCNVKDSEFDTIPSPFSFKVPIKDALNEHYSKDKILPSTTTSFYGDTRSTNAKPQVIISEEDISVNVKRTTSDRRAKKSDMNIDETIEGSSEPIKKKRGRKPKKIDDSDVNINESSNDPIKKKRGRKPTKIDDSDANIEESSVNIEESSEPIKKKRGRKPSAATKSRIPVAIESKATVRRTKTSTRSTARRTRKTSS